MESTRIEAVPAVRHTEAELVVELQQGSSVALGHLFDRHADRVFNHCFRRIGSWDLAEDATSATFLELWRSRDRASLHDGTALPWILGIATNVCRNVARKQRRHLRAVARLPRVDEVPDHAEAVAGRLDDERRMARLLEALEQLPPRDRELIALLAVVGATGTLLALRGDDEPTSPEVAPASAPTSVAADGEEGDAPEETTSPDEGAEVNERGEHTAADPGSPLPPEGYDDPSSCEADVPEHLGGAREVASIPYDGGRASLWEAGPVWVVCDTWAAEVDGGSTALIGARTVVYAVCLETFRVSGLISESGAHYFAAGPAIPSVTSIRYSFPDGHVEEAQLTDEMWLVTYLPTEGRLAKGIQTSERIAVEVTYAGGRVDDYTLEWGRDTCAQINHGC